MAAASAAMADLLWLALPTLSPTPDITAAGMGAGIGPDPAALPRRTGARGRLAPGLGKRRWPVGRSNARVLENKRLALRYHRPGFVIQKLPQAARISLVAGRSYANPGKLPSSKQMLIPGSGGAGRATLFRQ
jgi:hypothetical protein